MIGKGFAMDMTTLFPRSYHRSLAFLGRKDWLHLTTRREREDGIDTAGVLLSLSRPEQQASMLFMFAVSKCFATGPKVFLPTVER